MIENLHFLRLYTNKRAIGQRAPPQRAEAYLKVAELCLTNNTCLVSTIPSHPSVKLSSFKRLISGFPHSAPRWLFSRLCESHLSPIRWWWWGRQRCCSRALLLFTTRSCNKSAPDQSCPCAPPLIPTPTLLFDLKSEPWHKMASSTEPQSAPCSFRTDLVRELF